VKSFCRETKGSGEKGTGFGGTHQVFRRLSGDLRASLAAAY
jgi:hypothetical protein